jgi:hypothetical protein
MARTLNGAALNANFWSLTPLASNNVPVGTAYVGDFGAALTLFTRNATSVYLTDSHTDYFLRNVLVIMAETRAFAAVTEPLALIKVSGSVAPASGDVELGQFTAGGAEDQPTEPAAARARR